MINTLNYINPSKTLKRVLKRKVKHDWTSPKNKGLCQKVYNRYSGRWWLTGVQHWSSYRQVASFLGADELKTQFERVVADVVSKVFHKYKKDQTTGPTAQIQTISDNGQSITYASEMRNYLMTASDNELFFGVIDLLKVYRKPKVVKNETNW